MTTKRLIPLALAALLSAPAIAQDPQQSSTHPQPADKPVVVETVAAFEPVDETPADGVLPPEDDEDIDRRCLEDTGSRVTADPQPATAKDHTERDGHDCAIGNGTVHTREDLDGTGATNIKDALRALDPRVF